MKRITIFLDEQEEKNLNALIGRYGGKAPSFIKNLLRVKYGIDFPGYKQGIKNKKTVDPIVEQKTMTTPEVCESFGGVVDLKNLSGRGCLMVKDNNGKEKRFVPLTAMGLVSDYGDFRVEGIEVKRGDYY